VGTPPPQIVIIYYLRRMSGTGAVRSRQRERVRHERDRATRSGRRRAQRRASLVDLLLRAVLVHRAARTRRHGAAVGAVPAQREPKSWSHR